MNVIAKISCYFECSVVTLKLRKEYLNTVTYNIPVLLRIKYWTVRCTERYSMSTYTGVSNFQKTVWFFWPTLYMVPSSGPRPPGEHQYYTNSVAPGGAHKISTDIRPMLPPFLQGGQNVPNFGRNFDPKGLWTAVFLKSGILSDIRNTIGQDRW